MEENKNLIFQINLEIDTLAILTAKDTSFKIKKNILKWLKTKDIFIDKKHQYIFEICQKLLIKNENINIFTIMNLAIKNNIVNILNIEYLTEIGSSFVTEINYKSNCKILLDNYLNRVIKEEIQNNYSKEKIKEIYNFIKEFNIDNKENQVNLKDIQIFVDELITEKNSNEIYPLTSFDKLDKIINGLLPNKLITIGAMTGVGKTMFACNLLKNISEQQKEVLFFSLEMEDKEIVKRIWSMCLNIDSHKLENPKKLNIDEINQIKKLNNQLINEFKYINLLYGISELNEIIDIIKENINTKVVIIDYVQLISCMNLKEQNSVYVLTHITRKLKNLAIELKICIIILSQLKRESAERIPIAQDLKGSSSLEQDSDIVILLHKPKEITDFNTEIINLHIVKNRAGKSNEVINYNISNYGKFFEK